MTKLLILFFLLVLALSACATIYTPPSNDELIAMCKQVPEHDACQPAWSVDPAKGGDHVAVPTWQILKQTDDCPRVHRLVTRGCGAFVRGE